MPFCTVCSVRFNGRGSYCTRHKPYLRANYNAAESNNTNDHTGALTRYSHRSRNPLRIGLHHTHEALEPYRLHTSSNSLALAGFDLESCHNNDCFGDGPRADDILHTSNLKPLGYAFERLASVHAITQLTYAVDAYGTQSIIAVANPEREQCANCGSFFRDRYRLTGHFSDFPVQCDVHGVCLRCKQNL